MYWMHTCIDMSVFRRASNPPTGPADVVVHDLTVPGPHEPFVSDLSFTAPAGQVTVVPTDPGHPQAAVALALAGRMDGVTGSVKVAGRAERPVLQSLVRLVDVEDVSAPDDALPLRTVIGEELALADQRSSRAQVHSFLDQRGLTGLAGERWDRLPPETRVALLTELGAWRPGTRVVVIAGPDRHGGDPIAWLRPAEQVAEHGLTVIVLCARATATHLLQHRPDSSSTTSPVTPSVVPWAGAGRPATSHPNSLEEAHA